MNEKDAVPVKLPLVGEWCAFNTPGHRIPSHGTDLLGQRFAYDFFQIDWSREKGYKWHRSSRWKSFLNGVELEDALCWSQPIYSPFDAEVVEAYDGWKERNPAHLVLDVLRAITNGLTARPSSNIDLIPMLGNYVILKHREAYGLIAHAKCGSVQVAAGDKVCKGQKIAEVGHSGNSTAPHLHFQLMDSPELLKARGIPCCFDSYQTYANGEWKLIENGIPGRRERIRA